MQYKSTRGYDSNQTFSQILLEGLAPDGGLYMPKSYPQIIDKLLVWQNLSYADLAFEILSLFCNDIEPNILKQICEKTYTANIYAYTRENENPHDITPLQILEYDKNTPLALVALSNGPTLAFKDMAMQLLGNLFDSVLEQKQQNLNILGATSGDTGSAAEYAMRSKKNIKVFMLSPHNKMSEFQQAQMFSLQDSNIFNIAIEGFFDNCQDIVKNVANDIKFKQQYNLGTVNSINWARIVAQIIYYVKSYFLALKAYNLPLGHKVSFSVPSGNFGNVCAGHIAKQMGLPIDKLVVATNENNVLDVAFSSGIYKSCNAQQTSQTSSPSMDISKASNFERFIFDYYQQDTNQTQQAFLNFNTQGFINFLENDSLFNFKNKIENFGFVSSCSTHAHRLDIIRDTYARYGIIIDPHTADGIKGAREHQTINIPMLVLETAQATKFEDTINKALGFIPSRHVNFNLIEQKPKNLYILDNDVNKVKEFMHLNII